MLLFPSRYLLQAYLKIISLDFIIGIRGLEADL